MKRRTLSMIHLVTGRGLTRMTQSEVMGESGDLPGHGPELTCGRSTNDIGGANSPQTQLTDKRFVTHAWRERSFNAPHKPWTKISSGLLPTLWVKSTMAMLTDLGQVIFVHASAIRAHHKSGDARRALGHRDACLGQINWCISRLARSIAR